VPAKSYECPSVSSEINYFFTQKQQQITEVCTAIGGDLPYATDAADFAAMYFAMEGTKNYT